MRLVDLVRVSYSFWLMLPAAGSSAGCCESDCDSIFGQARRVAHHACRNFLCDTALVLSLGGSCSTFSGPVWSRRPSQKFPLLLRSACTRRRRPWVVGRPGFEPGLSASKADDLPLVDRPVVPGISRRSTLCEPLPRVPEERFARYTTSLREHLLPVLMAGERLCQKRPRTQRLHTLLSLVRRFIGSVDPEERRPGT